MIYFMARSPRFRVDLPYSPDIMNVMYIIYGVMGIGLALLGVLAIIGGVFALKRKHWGWALAGAIASTITFFPCGIAAIIFVTKGHLDFQPVVPKEIAANPPPSI
jgi:hypothetical protein